MPARLNKPELLLRVEEGFRAGGWNLLYLSAPEEHPARYRIYRDSQSLTIRVYIWNITHGGGPRSAAEYRIQITGLDANLFEEEFGGKTLILGWWPQEEVFAGFDYRRHKSPFGGSPSFQVGLKALRAAIVQRFSPHRKTSGELVIAFRPDFIATYSANLESLHDTGNVQSEADLLFRIAADPEAVPEEEIVEEIAPPRQYAVSETRRALRALDFSDRVLTAYGNRCALCGVQLRLLDGAHILPVSEPDSTDETANGVALCALHHRAYDRGLVTFHSDFEVHLHEDRIKELEAASLHGKLAEFRVALRKVIHLPPDKGDRPRQSFVKRANELRGRFL